MQQSQFKGTGVALVTPFQDGQVDFDALGHLIEHTIDGGVDYIVSLGTTGEAVTLSTKECKEVINFTINVIAGRVPIVLGLFGGNNTAMIIERFRIYDFDNVDAVLSSSPNYNKPTQEGIFQHYMAVQKESPKPIIIYNVPSRTSSNVDAATTLRLAYASDQFIGIKDASGDLIQAAQIAKNKPESFALLSGDDPSALPFIACGGEGIISVIANVFPRQFSDLICAALDNDFAMAQKIHLELLDIHPWLYVDGNPAGIKAALSMIGIGSLEVRLPLVPIQQENYLGLRKEMEKLLLHEQVKV